MILLIRPESDSDRDAVWNVNQQAFGNDAEANLVEALRDGGLAEVSLVAEIEGQIVGHILFSRMKILRKTGILESLSLAPMAVLPEFQRQRIGSKLVTVGLAACRAMGHTIVVVLGHPEYYPQFGFSSELAQPLVSPFGGGEAWMALELVPESLKGPNGTVEYPAPFDIFR